MSEPDTFYRSPILNTPYAYPDRHWELDADGQPTQRVVEQRRTADFVTPIPKPRKRGKKKDAQQSLATEAEASDEKQAYEKTAETVNAVRRRVDAWRKIPDRSKWGVTPETARLLDHWRNHEYTGLRPFFCQVEAVETAIWLTEVAPTADARAKELLAYLADANEEANPGLHRLALKLATGAGKTTVMAMLIAWQTINAARRPSSKRFTRGFLIVAPGITIRDRLRVLLPNDPDSYYAGRELVPRDLLPELGKARIVLTNYHAFKRRERMDVSKGGRALLEGRGEPMATLESEGQMLQRVCPELMGLKNVVVLNDEAHHCYRERPGDPEEALDSDQKVEAKENEEAARLWITGLEAVNQRLGVARVFDLSATPFFLAGSGYREGTLFPWTMSDFSLMDAIECGIVKLPRVPIADNSVNEDVPEYRVLWEHIGKEMPKGNRKAKGMSPEQMPTRLISALRSLYGHYQKTHEAWERAGIGVPPCFIVVCNNTSTSKLLYDFIAGYEVENEDGSTRSHHGNLALFRNTDEHGNPVHPMRTLLIDSKQLESGDALDKSFREAASAEIDQFRAEVVQRTGDRAAAEGLSDADLLREVMNTVGKEGKLGGQVRCVVSVSMLTEGWDANNVTHILGVRAFGTQLLCEQVIGRALRRQSYETNEHGLFEPEYADVFGIPFDFTAKAVAGTITPPPDRTHVKALPERAHLAVSFPRVEGYRVELPETTVKAEFTEDSTYTLTPDELGPSRTQNAGIVGEAAEMNVEHLRDERFSTIAYQLTGHVLQRKWRAWGGDGEPQMALFGKLKRHVLHWLRHHLECKGGTFPAQVLDGHPRDVAAERIVAAVVRGQSGDRPVVAVLAPYNPTGSTEGISFTTGQSVWETLGPPPKSHLNFHVLDSDWEGEFCRVAEAHPKVLAYAKNHNLGFEVPYTHGHEPRRYRPDFILEVDDGRGADDPLHLVVEVKGFRGEDAKRKAETMRDYWVPGVNHLGAFGRWAFAEFCDPYEMQDDFTEAVERRFGEMIDAVSSVEEPHAAE